MVINKTMFQIYNCNSRLQTFKLRMIKCSNLYILYANCTTEVWPYHTMETFSPRSVHNDIVTRPHFFSFTTIFHNKEARRKLFDKKEKEIFHLKRTLGFGKRDSRL